MLFSSLAFEFGLPPPVCASMHATDDSQMLLNVTLSPGRYSELENFIVQLCPENQ